MLPQSVPELAEGFRLATSEIFRKNLRAFGASSPCEGLALLHSLAAPRSCDSTSFFLLFVEEYRKLAPLLSPFYPILHTTTHPRVTFPTRFTTLDLRHSTNIISITMLSSFVALASLFMTLVSPPAIAAPAAGISLLSRDVGITICNTSVVGDLSATAKAHRKSNY